MLSSASFTSMREISAEISSSSISFPSL
jgi:hypothetical protein